MHLNKPIIIRLAVTCRGSVVLGWQLFLPLIDRQLATTCCHESPPCHLQQQQHSLKYRRLADGDVHCAGIATYQIFLGYRSRTLTRSLTLNPNPITDPNPNPKINKKQNDIRMKLNLELYLKVDFLGTGVGL